MQGRAECFWKRIEVRILSPFLYAAQSVKFLPPRLQHKGAIRKGKADFSQPDTYCTRVDVWSRIHHYHLQQKTQDSHNDIEYMETSQMKHQLVETLCRFYFCRVTLHVSGASAHHQEYLKLVRRPLVHVLSLQVSHHISVLGPAGPNKEM